MKNMTVIPPKPQKGNAAAKEEVKRLRVAAYCRVSTDNEEQASSYEAQIQHYEEFIKTNPEWEFVGVYADEGISATNTKKRDQFNAMIKDCKQGKIDMIFTKSISRFARNTLDCLQYIRLLKEINIPVFFEKESINTMDAKGEVLITLMASLAQQESESLSKNTKMGIQYRFQQGKVMVNAKHLIENSDGYLSHLKENLKTAINLCNPQSTEALAARMNQLQQEMIDRTESRQNYDDLVEEILLLREQQEQNTMDEAAKAEHRDRIQALCNFINSQPRTITKFDGTLVRKLLKDVKVCDVFIEFRFKSGTSVIIEK